MIKSKYSNNLKGRNAQFIYWSVESFEKINSQGRIYFQFSAFEDLKIQNWIPLIDFCWAN